MLIAKIKRVGGAGTETKPRGARGSQLDFGRGERERDLGVGKKTA